MRGDGRNPSFAASAAAVFLLVMLQGASCTAEEPTSPMAVVAGSAAGRNLLADLESACGPPPSVGFELFIAELEAHVSRLTGRLVDGSDPEFVEAARSLRRVPRRVRQDSLATVIVLLDEWSRRTAQQQYGERAVDVLKRHSWSRRSDVRARQIIERFPLLAPTARDILASVGVRDASATPVVVHDPFVIHRTDRGGLTRSPGPSSS
jgi:hypothetical protein